MWSEITVFLNSTNVVEDKSTVTTVVITYNACNYHNSTECVI